MTDESNSSIPGSKRSRPFIWVIAICLVYVAFVYFLNWKMPETARSLSVLGDNTFLLIGMIIIFIGFYVLVQTGGSEAEEKVMTTEAKPAPPPPTPPPPPPQPKAEFKRVEETAVKAEVVEEPNVIVYPKRVDSGLYGDTFIKVDNYTVLQLRTPLVDEDELMV